MTDRDVLIRYARDVSVHKEDALERALAALPTHDKLMRLLAKAVADADGWCDEARGVPSPDLKDCREALRAWRMNEES